MDPPRTKTQNLRFNYHNPVSLTVHRPSPHSHCKRVQDTRPLRCYVVTTHRSPFKKLETFGVEESIGYSYLPYGGVPTPTLTVPHPSHDVDLDRVHRVTWYLSLTRPGRGVVPVTPTFWDHDTHDGRRRGERTESEVDGCDAVQSRGPTHLTTPRSLTSTSLDPTSVGQEGPERKGTEGGWGRCGVLVCDYDRGGREKEWVLRGCGAEEGLYPPRGPATGAGSNPRTAPRRTTTTNTSRPSTSGTQPRPCGSSH